MEYPTVTQILSPYNDFSQISPARLAQAADRGSRVHDAIGYYLSRGEHPGRIEDDVWSYYKAAINWINEMVERIRYIEIRQTDFDLGLSGKPDLICELKGDNGLTLLDWKTAQSHQKIWSLQIAAYRHLANVNHIKTIRGMSVRLKRNGSGVVVTEYDPCYYDDYHIFLGMFNAYNFIKPKTINWGKI